MLRRAPAQEPPGRRRRGRLSAAALLALAAGAGAAGAGRDADACFEGSGRPELDVRICERAQWDETLSPLSRATLHVRRAAALLALGRAEEALAANDAALESNPLSAEGELVVRR